MRAYPSIAVIIPCYKVTASILDVLTAIRDDVCAIYIVDDACPEKTGMFVKTRSTDPRVKVLFHKHNQGVGGAVLTGYHAALCDGHHIMVKIDGDGQMDPAILPHFVSPIISGDFDYTKGNRFYTIESLESMPKIRIFGNAVLSFMTKISSGYWSIFDPTNGYTAVHRDILEKLPFHKISQRYFFETDMLFHLNLARARVTDVPMNACYKGEVSNLHIKKVIFEFAYKNLRNFLMRIFYNYYLRDMAIASIELPVGLFLIALGAGFGMKWWIHSLQTGIFTSAGSVMLAALPIILGTQLLLSVISYDISSEPNRKNAFPGQDVGAIRHRYKGEKN
jgi:glycosyltransferase involved in cell wall biosynthesis